VPRFELAGKDRHYRIVPQFMVVVDIFITERNSKHPLAR